jgi:uncharacterized membrane protein
MKTELSLREVLAQLAAEGLAQPLAGELPALPSMTMDERASTLPGFVKLFIGVSAWIAAILITSFLFIIEIIDEESKALGFGLVFCALAIGLNRLARGNIFLGQLALALSLTGQGLAIVGLFSLFDYNKLPPVVVSVTILESILIVLHRDAVLRFLSTLVIVSFVIALIFDEEIYDSLYLLILVLTVGSLYIRLMENRLKLTFLGGMLAPVGAALTFSFLGILTLPLSDEFDLNWQIPAVTFFVLLLFLLVRITLDLGYTLQNRVVVALTIGCILLLIPSLRMPGILAALLVLTLGFWRNSRDMIGLAAIFLIFYIWAYYYSLEWTLLAKSLVLLGSGIILLALRYFVVQWTSKAGGEA